MSVKVAHLCPTLQPHGLWSIQSMEFSRPEYWSGQPFPSPRVLPNPGIESRSPTLQEDSLPAEPQGKPKSTGVGSLALLQWIFLTQDLNWGLLHCRWILYQLSYQGSPINGIQNIKKNVIPKGSGHFNMEGEMGWKVVSTPCSNFGNTSLVSCNLILTL